MIPASASYNFTIRTTQQLHQIWGFLPTTRRDKEEEQECEKNKEGNTEKSVHRPHFYLFPSWISPSPGSRLASAVLLAFQPPAAWVICGGSSREVVTKSLDLFFMPLQEKVGCRERRMEDTTQTFLSGSKAKVPIRQARCFLSLKSIASWMKYYLSWAMWRDIQQVV